MRLFWAISTHCEVCISLSPEKLRQNSGRFWRFSFLYFFALQVELARKRGWKGYWVCLKGTTLLFYPCESKEGQSVEATPRHLIIVDGSIMQSIPEHPKRDFIFCLSTAFGDAYLFQVIANEGQKEKGIQSGYLITKKVSCHIRTTEYSNPVRGTILAYVRIPVFFK